MRDKDKNLGDQLNDYRQRASKYFMSVEHQINFVSIALNELVLSSDDSGNLEKVEPVLSLIMFTFYN